MPHDDISTHGRPEQRHARTSPSRLARVGILVLLGSLTFGCDQLTKELATRHLEGRGVRPVLDRVIVLVYAENTGAFLSLGGGLPFPLRFVLLSVVPTALVVGMVAYAVAVRSTSWTLVIGLGFATGGGSGNLVDRLLDHAVVDFMNVGIGPLRTGVFNVADLAIILGCLLVLIGGARCAGGGSPEA